MLQRSVLVFTFSSALLACGDSGSSTGGLSSAGITSLITSATNVSTATASAGSSGDDSGQGGTQNTGGTPTSTIGETATSAGSTGGVEDTSTSAAASTSTSTSTSTTSTTSTSGDSTTGECAAITEMAMNKKQPADIIFVIDDSGSMAMEIASVAANLNNFSTKIINSGIDVHVVMISSFPDNGGICVDKPLGSGGCPVKDNNPPKYTHINSKVGSNNALQLLLDHYPDYKDLLRPDSAKHVVVVTDDNSSVSANTFDNKFKALDPGLAGYKMHAICGAKDVDDVLWCVQNAVCCAFTAKAGKVYLDLINKTGGEWGDLCLQNFTPVFDVLSTEVIQNSSLACEWVIPDPMGDDPIDFNKVNVEFDDGMNNIETIGKVESEADCANVSEGWYYDDPMTPTKILVCPQTCLKIQGVKDAKINIKFGCETVIAQ